MCHSLFTEQKKAVGTATVETRDEWTIVVVK